MADNAGRIAGIVSIVLSVLSGVGGILNLMSRYPRRGLAFLIACGILLVLGIFLVVMSSRSSSDASGH